MSSFNNRKRYISRAMNLANPAVSQNWLSDIAYPAIAEYFALCKNNTRVYFIPEKVNKMYEKISLTPVETPERRYQLMSSYIKNLVEMHGILFLYVDSKDEPSEAYIMACNKSTNYNLTLFTGAKCRELELKLSGATSNATVPGENQYPAIDLKSLFEAYAKKLSIHRTMS